MKPKTPLPWDHVPSQGTFRVLPEDWEFAVHAANSHDKYKAIINELSHWVKIYNEQRRAENPELLKLIQRAWEATKE